MRASKHVALAIVLITMGAGFARAEIYNEFCNKPTSSATTFVIVFKGNVIADLNLTATANDPTVNPFAYVNQKIVDSGTSSVTATLNSSGNTVVTYSGTNPILPSYTFQYTNGNGMPHFGIDGSVSASVPGGGPTFNIISQTWNYASGSTTSEPSLSVANPSAPTSGKIDYITFYATVTSGTVSAGQWFEVPFVQGTSPTLTLTNYTSSQETLSNVGYMLSPTLIPLDNLNYQTLPPPGSSGSPFTSLPQYNGDQLTAGDGMGGAGGTITTSALPEPSSIISLSTGLLFVVSYAGRRRISARHARAARAV